MRICRIYSPLHLISSYAFVDKQGLYTNLLHHSHPVQYISTCRCISVYALFIWHGHFPSRTLKNHTYVICIRSEMEAPSAVVMVWSKAIGWFLVVKEWGQVNQDSPWSSTSKSSSIILTLRRKPHPVSNSPISVRATTDLASPPHLEIFPTESPFVLPTALSHQPGQGSTPPSQFDFVVLVRHQ